MTDEMVEIVAKALFEYDQNRPFNSNLLLYGTRDKVTWEFVTSKNVTSTISDGYRNQAKAVIKAMREPTEDMIAEVIFEAPAGEIIGQDVVKILWQRMIDKALEE